MRLFSWWEKNDHHIYTNSLLTLLDFFLIIKQSEANGLKQLKVLRHKSEAPPTPPPKPFSLQTTNRFLQTFPANSNAIIFKWDFDEHLIVRRMRRFCFACSDAGRVFQKLEIPIRPRYSQFMDWSHSIGRGAWNAKLKHCWFCQRELSKCQKKCLLQKKLWNCLIFF